jgi:hypothetical protein
VPEQGRRGFTQWTDIQYPTGDGTGVFSIYCYGYAVKYISPWAVKYSAYSKMFYIKKINPSILGNGQDRSLHFLLTRSSHRKVCIDK